MASYWSIRPIWYTEHMSQIHERRQSDNPYIDTVWKSVATSDGTYLVTPDGSWDIIAAEEPDGTKIVFLAGQVTKPTRLPYKAGNKSVVISLSAGAYLPYLSGAVPADSFIMLPVASNTHFKLAEHTFAIPTYNTVEELVDEMISSGVLKNDSIVAGILHRTPKAASKRSVQRHFKTTTGISHKKLEDIQRAQQAVRLLKKGTDPTTTASDTGYYDQPHLTKSLKRLMDSSPSSVDDINQV